MSGEREVLALLLEAHTDDVVRALRELPAARSYPALLAIARTRGLFETLDDVLHTLVRQARSEGTTWAEIGSFLHITRQAAFQRFGKPEEEATMTTLTTETAIAKAVVVLGDLYPQNRWSEMREDFDERMLEALSEEALAAGWSQLLDAVGEYVSTGQATARMIGDHAVVDAPMKFANAEMKGRVAFNTDGSVAGLFVLDPSVP